MSAGRGCSGGGVAATAWLAPRPRARDLVWRGGCQYYLRVLEFLLFWDLNWTGNWGLTLRALLMRFQGVCSGDK